MRRFTSNLGARGFGVPETGAAAPSSLRASCVLVTWRCLDGNVQRAMLEIGRTTTARGTVVVGSRRSVGRRPGEAGARRRSQNAMCDQLQAVGVPLESLEMCIMFWSRALDGLDPDPFHQRVSSASIATSRSNESGQTVHGAVARCPSRPQYDRRRSRLEHSVPHAGASNVGSDECTHAIGRVTSSGRRRGRIHRSRTPLALTAIAQCAAAQQYVSASSSCWSAACEARVQPRSPRCWASSP